MIGVVLGSLVATTLAVVISIASEPLLFGLDLQAYTFGAARLLATGSPYSEELRRGPIEHLAENVPIAYLYPPILAQLFVPLTVFPISVLSVLWSASQAAILAVTLVGVLRRYRPGSTWPEVVFALAAAAAYYPTQVAITIGNVSGWIAIAVGLLLIAGPAGRAAIAAATAWLKVLTGAVLVGAVVDRSSRRYALATAVLIPVLSVLISPTAWLDFFTVLPNLVAMPSTNQNINLAPARVLNSVGMGGPAGLLAMVLPVAFLILTVVNAHRGRLLPWIAAAVGVYLTATGTSWHQYFVVLVPLAFAIWPSASKWPKMAIACVWLLHSALWFTIEVPAFQLLGLTVWLALLAWASVRPDPAGAILVWPTRQPSQPLDRPLT